MQGASEQQCVPDSPHIHSHPAISSHQHTSVGSKSCICPACNAVHNISHSNLAAPALLRHHAVAAGTKINWTAAIRPPQHVREEWATTYGLSHLGPDAAGFDAALDTVCSRLGVGVGTSMSTPNAKLQEGLQALGQHVEEYPRNCLSKTCSAYCNLGCRSGHKQSSEVWLLDAVRAGAHLLTGVHAQQVTTQPCQVSLACSQVWGQGVASPAELTG